MPQIVQQPAGLGICGVAGAPFSFYVNVSSGSLAWSAFSNEAVVIEGRYNAGPAQAIPTITSPTSGQLLVSWTAAQTAVLAVGGPYSWALQASVSSVGPYPLLAGPLAFGSPTTPGASTTASVDLTVDVGANTVDLTVAIGASGVASVTAANDTITVGGTSSAPTIAVTPGTFDAAGAAAAAQAAAEAASDPVGSAAAAQSNAETYAASQASAAQSAAEAASVPTAFLPSTGTSGAPTSGTGVIGEQRVDSSNRTWDCTASGTPGTWVLSGTYVPTAGAAAGEVYIEGLGWVSGAAVTEGGSLGAAQALNCGTNPSTWLVGTLTANLTVTLSNLAAGASAFFYLTQDGTGGRTLTVDYGESSQSVTIGSAAAAVSLVQIYSPDGTTLYIVVAGGVVYMPVGSYQFITSSGTGAALPAGSYYFRVVGGGAGGGGGGAAALTGGVSTQVGGPGGVPGMINTGVITIATPAVPTFVIGAGTSGAAGGAASSGASGNAGVAAAQNPGTSSVVLNGVTINITNNPGLTNGSNVSLANSTASVDGLSQITGSSTAEYSTGCSGTATSTTGRRGGLPSSWCSGGGGAGMAASATEGGLGGNAGSNLAATVDQTGQQTGSNPAGGQGTNATANTGGGGGGGGGGAPGGAGGTGGNGGSGFVEFWRIA